jgi:hypothetical protein
MLAFHIPIRRAPIAIGESCTLTSLCLTSSSCIVVLQEGHRPDRIVSPSLRVGGNLQLNASNGKTQVFMNGRELGKLELKMLKVRKRNHIVEFFFFLRKH